MTDREIERSNHAPDSTGDDAGGTSAHHTTVDAAAQSFFDREETIVAPSTPLERGTTRARVVDASRVPHSSVPEDYPVSITTDEAVALELAIDEERVTAFFDWPDGSPTDALTALMALHDIPLGRFADLYGTRLLVTVVNGYWVPIVPPTPPRGNPRAVYGVYAGLGFNLATVGTVVLAVTGLGGSALLANVPFVVAFLATNWFLLPISTYVDARHLRSTTDWGQGPLFWALMAGLFLINVVTSVAYLRSRGRSRPLAE